MRDFKLQEMAEKLKGAIEARRYLDRNPIAVQVLPKVEAEVYVAIHARSLFAFFVDRALWTGLGMEDANNVLSLLVTARDCITENQRAKQSMIVRCADCVNFIAENLDKQRAVV